ncbi:MAG: sigma-70 family RNA polymerase sigma factor [Chloroflexi bacterium]|nr:sigma-70 family RNA polymerase sigma factor [Anaerolineaceae bacterium]NMB87228.1 sigma-70 family RNA polymerase sigma factor [Chloroflexota bacterium]
MDEQQAIAYLKRGDPGGLEVLVELYQLQALRAACLITGDRPLAEDIVQNAFLRAAQRIEQFDDQRPFGPWFLRSVINDALKAVERQKRLLSLEGEGEDEALELVDGTPLPEELVERAETRQALWQALEQLPPRQRAAIVLRYYLGMSEADMAGELDGPAGTVKWWLHSARQRLRRLLGPHLAVESLPQSPRGEHSERDCQPGGR